ncbi:MAG: histidinol phosphatase [Deltaproteobacteria bacterium]|nr:histidinol phosphatase [Deltaproteobacteria bacterium]
MFWKNYHAHTYRCKHAKGDAVHFARAARAGGASVYGMSDHAALPDNRWNNVRMAHQELNDYVAAVRYARTEVPEITVLLGMECEDVPEFRSYYKEELLGRRHFDYLIGAGHYTPLEGEWLNSFSELTNARALRAYSDHLAEMMVTGLYAFIAHPDVYGACLDRWNAEAAACARDILAAAAETNTPLEINGNGLHRHPIHTSEGTRVPYPWKPFWELAAEYPVTVICNSDAHRPEDALRGLSELHAIAEENGLTLADLSYLEPPNQAVA